MATASVEPSLNAQGIQVSQELSNYEFTTNEDKINLNNINTNTNNINTNNIATNHSVELHDPSPNLNQSALNNTSYSEGGPRQMKIECLRARSGWRVYYVHRIYDDKGDRIYELLSASNKSLVVKDQAGKNVLSTTSKFPFKHFELHITAPVAIKTAVFEFKAVRKSQSSIEMDGAIYKPVKIKAKKQKIIQWVCADGGEVMATQTKNEIVFSQKCSRQLERAIIFAICYKCLHHDNS